MNCKDCFEFRRGAFLAIALVVVGLISIVYLQNMASYERYEALANNYTKMREQCLRACKACPEPINMSEGFG